MASNTNELDIAQRIAEALARTSEPECSASGSMEESGEIIGTVPKHLRHLHNLLAQLAEESAEANVAFRTKQRQVEALHELFFGALEMHVPQPKGSSGVILMKNWDVAALRCSESKDEGARGTSLERLMEKLAGRRR